MITIQDMVQREINCCMSSLVAVLRSGAHWFDPSRARYSADAQDLRDLAQQAFDLSSPIPDYEEAAIQAGWSHISTEGDRAMVFLCKHDSEICHYSTWGELCEEHDIEPYDHEVYEHWAVSDWLADKLIAKGEKVDKDFTGLCVWARTTTGQAIHADAVIEAIYNEMVQA